MSKKPKIQKRPGLKGYRLHDARIDYSGGSGSMRTVKYPLVGEAEDAVFKAIKHDYLALYGDTNFSDFLQSKQTGKARYSFLEFWAQAVLNGFVFAKESHAQSDFTALFGKKIEATVVFELLPEHLKKIINQAKFEDWWVKKGDTRARKNAKQIFEKDKIDETICEQCAALENADRAGFCKIFGVCESLLPARSASPYTKPFAFNYKLDLAKITGRTITEKLDSLINIYKAAGFDTKPKGKLSNYFALYELNQGIFPAVFKLAKFLQEGKFDYYVDLFVSHFGGDKEIVRAALKNLKGYADQLPARPKLVERWEDYNTDLGGTLESWYSNRGSKQIETINGLIKVKTALAEINEKTKKYLEENTSAQPAAEPLLGSISALNQILAKVQNLPSEELGKKEGVPVESTGISHSLSERFFAAQAVFRTVLNEFLQKHQDFNELIGAKKKGADDGSEKESDKASLRRAVETKVQNSPLFFGESQREYFEKAYQAKALLKENFQQLQTIYSDLEKDGDQEIEVTAKQVQGLATSFATCDHEAVKEAYDRLQEVLDTQFWKLDDKHKYYRSPFAKGKFSVDLTFRAATIFELAKAADLVTLYELVKKDLNDLVLARDVVNLSKNLLSALARLQDPKKAIEINYNFSEISGLVMILSKKEFIARYPLQAVNGKQAKLFFDGVKQKFGYVFPGVSGEFSETSYFKKSINYKDLDKELFFKKDKKQVATGKVAGLQIQSSRYQMQFLRWLFAEQFGEFKNRQTDLIINGPFSIGEQDSLLDWSDDSPTCESAESRVYTSQPFTISPRERRREEFSQQRFIGVDIGEYGLAYCVINVDESAAKSKVEIIDSGWIESDEQRVLKDGVKKLRAKQVKATFTSADTHIANLRESLIGGYKNRLHSLVVKHNARLSFEIQVSAFESGGNKISKIYDSVKRGSFYGTNDAEKADAKLAFGAIDQKDGKSKTDKQMVPWGVQITAAGTSRTCSKCGRWYSHPTEADQKLPVRFLENNAINNVPLGKLSEEQKKGIYPAMRPPLDGMGMEVVRQWAKENGFDLDSYNQRRGNSAVFVCPFCGHIADADAQAALNIAVRGYLKAKDLYDNPLGKNEKRDFNTLFYVQRWSDVDIPEVGLV